MKKILLIMLSILFLAGCSDTDVFISENKVCDPINENDCLEVVNGVIPVEKIDQTTQALELLLTSFVGDFDIIDNLTLGQNVFNISTNITPLPEQHIGFKDIGGNSFSLLRISNVTSLGGDIYEIETLAGVEFAYSNSDGRSIRNSNLAVDGSVTPQIFAVGPGGLNDLVSWDITRLICIGAGDGVPPGNDKPDKTDFFTTVATDKGILFRSINNILHKNLFYARTNNDFSLHMFDLIIDDANKNGEYAVSWRKSINGDDKSGVVIRLDANQSSIGYHSFQAIVDRDLTDVSLIECNLMGHETDTYVNSLE